MSTKPGIDRRTFIQSSLVAGLAGGLVARAIAQPQDQKPAEHQRKILILGGTGFLGPAIVAAAEARGHTVTLFNRGKTRPGLFPNIEQLHGDRDPLKTAVITNDDGSEERFEGVKSLEGRSWDTVFDDSGYYPRMVKASAEVLGPNVQQYVFISSVSAYAQPQGVGDNEDGALAELKDPEVETMGEQFQNYGGLKVLCERAAEAAAPGKVTVVRPGFIVGPDDPTGRFTYWPVRVDRGGEVLAPGDGRDSIQLIDVRDLAEWLVMLAEKRTIGTFDALGPRAGELMMAKMLAACEKATTTPHTLTWVPTEFLLKNDISPGGDLPIWLPSSGESEGFHQRNVSRAIDAGLKFRPIEETCRDTLEWWKSLDEKDRRKRLAGMSALKEIDVLKAFHEQETGAKEPTSPASGS